MTVTVDPVNDAPVADAQTVEATEDTAKPITLTGSDVDGDTLSYIIVGSPSHGTLSGTGADLTYTPSANYHGQDSFTFRVNDGTIDGAVATVTINVAAVNDAPVAAAQAITTDEDTAKGGTVTATDVDGDSLAYTLVGVNGGAAHGTVVLNSDGTFTYTPASNFHGTDSFTYRANDGTVDSNIATVTVTVNAMADTPNLTVADVAGDENAPIPLGIAAALVDTDGSEALTIRIDGVPATAVLAAGTKNPDGSWSLTAADLPGLTLLNSDNLSPFTLTVTATATETSGGNAASTQGSILVAINNVAPKITGLIGVPVGPFSVNSLVGTFTADFSDVGTADTHTAEWDWGDGSPSSAGIVNESNGSGTVSGSHIYRAAGVYTVTLIVRDDDGGVVSKQAFDYVVIYDPDAGFVTGGGTFDSPVNSALEYMQESGRAHFGFVSRYVKQGGTTKLTGQTQFQFQAGNLNFQSSSYEWLVVNQAGTNAQYKGSGTINGTGNYRFMLWAGDGTAPGQADTFRIKIWRDSANGAENVVYDNGTDQAISGGSIVIHRPKK